jgi:hypothetical protein
MSGTRPGWNYESTVIMIAIDSRTGNTTKSFSFFVPLLRFADILWPAQVPSVSCLTAAANEADPPATIKRASLHAANGSRLHFYSLALTRRLSNPKGTGVKLTMICLLLFS